MATAPPITSLKMEDFSELGKAIGTEQADKLLRAINTGLSTTADQSSRSLVMNNAAWQVKDITVAPKDDWKTPALTNNWTNFVANEPAQALKTDHGLVFLRGRVTPGAGSNGAAAFTVPSDYAPSRQRFLDTTSAGAASASANVTTAGAVILSYNGNPAWVAVDTVWVAADRHPELNPLYPMRVKLELGGRKVRGWWVIKARDLTGAAEGHVGNPAYVDGYQDGADFVIENISGLNPGRTFTIRLLFLGA
jgi:hypothetical protein